MQALTQSVDGRLDTLGSGQPAPDEGFRKTNETFASVMARLATIDEAQKKIDGLTTNVVSLQELLGDKRARGAFGEVQLENLVRNMLPPEAFAFQQVLPNGTRWIACSPCRRPPATSRSMPSSRSRTTTACSTTRSPSSTAAPRSRPSAPT